MDRPAFDIVLDPRLVDFDLNHPSEFDQWLANEFQLFGDVEQQQQQQQGGVQQQQQQQQQAPQQQFAQQPMMQQPPMMLQPPHPQPTAFTGMIGFVPCAGPCSGPPDSLLQPALFAVPGPNGTLMLAASPGDAAAMATAQQQQQQLVKGAGGRKGRGIPAASGEAKPKGPSTRFRERQRQTIANLQAEVTERLAQLRALNEENERLKLKSAVLEAAVKGREYHLNVIKEHGPPVFPGEQADDAASGCTSSAGKATCSQQAATPGASADTASDTETCTPPAASPADGFARLGSSDSSEQQPAMDAINNLKHATAEDIVDRWKRFLQDVTGELLQAEQEARAAQLSRLASGEPPAAGDPAADLASPAETVSAVCRWCSCCNSEGCSAAAPASEAAAVPAEAAASGSAAAAVPGASSASALPGVPASHSTTATERRIMELVYSVSHDTKFVALLNPGVLYQVMGRNLDTGLQEGYTDAHWRRVVQHLGLSKHQVKHILECAELYFRSLSTLMVERSAIQKQLQVPEDPLACCAARLSGPDGTVNQLQVLEKLASNLKREHVLRIMLNCFVWGRSLNCIQFAKSAVHSHPFYPDVHAMVCVIYEDAQGKAPGAAEQLLPVSPLQAQRQQLQAQGEQLQAEGFTALLTSA